MTTTVTRADLAEDITLTNHRAKRDMPKVGDTLHPTAWDIHHKRIDAMLTEWEAADGQAPTPDA